MFVRLTCVCTDDTGQKNNNNDDKTNISNRYQTGRQRHQTGLYGAGGHTGGHHNVRRRL